MSARSAKRTGQRTTPGCLAAMIFAVLGYFVAIPAAALADETPKVERNSLGMQLVSIQPGVYERGVKDVDRLRKSHPNTMELTVDLQDERPAHPVRITRPFSIGAHEVTVGQFRGFVKATQYVTTAEKSGQGALAFQPSAKTALARFALDPNCTWKSPGFEQTDDHPAVGVSWTDAVAFCEWLSKTEGATYRLPTEAEWEYAARAGADTTYVGGDTPDTIYAYGNIGDAALEAAAPGVVRPQQPILLEPGQGDGVVYTSAVGRFKPNAWGLYDTHGNVWEWCSDRYYDRYYEQLVKAARAKAPPGKMNETVDPPGPDSTPQHKHGDWRTMRGGSWCTGPMGARSVSRAFGEANDAFCYTGFRVLKEHAR